MKKLITKQYHNSTQHKKYITSQNRKTQDNQQNTHNKTQDEQNSKKKKTVQNITTQKVNKKKRSKTSKPKIFNNGYKKNNQKSKTTT